MHPAGDTSLAFRYSAVSDSIGANSGIKTDERVSVRTIGESSSPVAGRTTKLFCALLRKENPLGKMRGFLGWERKPKPPAARKRAVALVRSRTCVFTRRTSGDHRLRENLHISPKKFLPSFGCKVAF